MSIENNLDSLHAKVKQNSLLQYFTLFNRVILAMAFLPSGMTKVLGIRFTQIPIDNPVGFFFESFYRAQGWYRFVGIAQVLAAILLLIPRTSTLGAAIFFPIVLNIMIITISIPFTGTWVITSLMFLANLYLLCWDYDKFKAILPFSSEINQPFKLKTALPLIILFAIGGVFAFGFFMLTSPAFNQFGYFSLVIGFIGGALIGGLNSWSLQKN